MDKKNTFCFDSESFRYLVALQNGIIFDQLEKDEFIQSWIRSAEESQRLRTSLCNEFPPYRRNIEWQSIKDIHYQINSMIRPILEGIRNILRNIILYSKNCSIRLKATTVSYPTMICYKCDRVPKQFEDFWIYPDLTHSCSNECPSNELFPTEYILDYEYLPNFNENSKNILVEQEKFLCNACIQFTHFLLVTDVKQEDPFLLGLRRMSEEEESICQKYQKPNHNNELVSLLGAFREKYTKSFAKTNLNNDDQLLSTIYKLIQSMNETPVINEQVHAIQKYQQYIVRSTECDLNEQSTSA